MTDRTKIESVFPVARMAGCGWAALVRPCIASIVIAAVGGCVQVPHNSGFSDVQVMIGDQVDQRIEWRRDATEDAELGRAVETLISQSMTVQEVIQVALLNNRSLQAVYDELGISHADVIEAAIPANPSFSGLGRFADGSPPSGSNVEIEFAYNFLSLLMQPARQRLAAIEFERVKLRVADQVLQLVTDTEQAYISLVAAKQVVQVHRLAARAAQASSQMAQRMKDAGNLSELAVTREQIVRENIELDLADSMGEADEARQQLSALMGFVKNDSRWGVPDRLPEVPETAVGDVDLEIRALERRFDFQAGLQEVKALSEALGIAGDWRGFLDAEVGVSSDRDVDGLWVTGPTLSIELPIFDQGQADIARHEAQLRQSQNRLDALVVKIRSQVRTLCKRLELHHNKAARLREVVIPLHDQVVTLTNQKYNFMLSGVFELLEVQREQIAASHRLVNATRDYWNTLAELERAVGGGLPGHDFAGAMAAMNPPPATRQSITAPSTQPANHSHHGQDRHPDEAHDSH